MSANYTVGSSIKAGRRPNKYHTPKADLERVIRACYEFGLGSNLISRLTGYSAQQIRNYARDLGIDRKATAAERAQWIMSLLPESLQADLRIIRTKSEVAHARAANREIGVSSKHIHRLDENAVA